MKITLKRIIALFFTILTISTLCISVSSKNYYGTYSSLPEEIKPYVRFLMVDKKIQGFTCLYPIIYSNNVSNINELRLIQSYIKRDIPCLEDVYNNFDKISFSNDLSIECERSYKHTSYYLIYQNNRNLIYEDNTNIQCKLKFSIIFYNNRWIFAYGIVPYDDSTDYTIRLKTFKFSFVDSFIMYQYENVPAAYKLIWGFDNCPDKIFYLEESINNIKNPFVKFFTDLAESLKNGFDKIFLDNGGISQNGYTIIILISLFFAISIIIFIFKLFRRKI